MSEAERLRAEIKKKRQAVSAKIARMKRQNNADVSGTSFDPRRAAGTENRMRSTNNMQNYLSELNDFMRRSNQFVGLAGEIARKQQFTAYKRKEQAVNALADKREIGMGKTILPNGWTIAQQHIALPEVGGSAVYGPYKKFDRQASDIQNVAGLIKLTEQMDDRLSQEYLPTKIGEGRNNLEKALDYLGLDDMQRSVEDMSDYQFDILWFGANNFANSIFTYYNKEKDSRDGNRKERWQDAVIDAEFENAKEMIEFMELDWQKLKHN